MKKVFILIVFLFCMSSPTSRAEMCLSDNNCDGKVGLNDLVKMKEEYMRTDCDPVCLPGVFGGVPKTGQTTCYDTDGNPRDCAGTGQDGDLKKGVAWPNPRFTDNGGGTVTDNLTGLVWTKDAQQIPGAISWQAALNACNSLDYAGYDDWRLPNLNELNSLIDRGNINPALPSGHPFTNVAYADGLLYWSSTTFEFSTEWVWIIRMDCGLIGPDDRSNIYENYIWPVRGGQ